MPRWTREPLVHFLAIGALLLGLNALLGPGSRKDDVGGRAGDADMRVVVTGSDISRLSAAWEQRWRRPPTEEELAGLIDRLVRDEIYFREALDMGLERDDADVRRRLVEKMEYLSSGLGDQVEPTEAELRAHMAADPERFGEPERRSFTHVFFSPELRTESAWSDAETVLAELRRMEPSPRRAPEKGDPFVMQFDFKRRSRSEISRQMGEDLAERVFAVEGDDWQGPERSDYGIHLLRVHAISEGASPDFTAVREEVRADFLRQRGEVAAGAFYDDLRARYEVVVQPMSNAGND